MKDFLNESKAAFTKEKIEEIVLEYCRSIKGMIHEIDSSYSADEVKILLKKFNFYDEKLNDITITKISDEITYVGAHEEAICGYGICQILGKFKGEFETPKGKKYSTVYSPIVVMSEPDKRYFIKTIFDLYSRHVNQEKNSIDFYIPGIFKALNEAGYGIQYVSHTTRKNIDNKDYIDINIKIFDFYDQNRVLYTFYDENAAKKMVKTTLSIYKFTKEFNTSSKYLEENGPRYVEKKSYMSVEDLLELMRKNDIDFEDVKVNHKGISSIYDTGLFENKNI